MASISASKQFCTENNAPQTSFEEFLDILASLTLSTTPLSIDLDRKCVHLNHQKVELTAQEFDLLAHLAQHVDTIVSREELFSTVWAHRPLDAQSRTIDAHIRRLRVKLGNAELISTVRGAGYRLNSVPTIAMTITHSHTRSIALVA